MSCSPYAELYIVTKDKDGIYTKISFLDGIDGLFLQDWSPSVLNYQGDGVRSFSPLSDGSRVLDAYWADMEEGFTLASTNKLQDVAIDNLRAIGQLLIQAVEYWQDESWLVYPVWLEAKSTFESNTRYAPIKFWRLPGHGNPYANPFLNPSLESTLEGILINIEHEPWSELEPGEESCLELSSKSQIYGNQTTVSDTPLASADDAMILTNPLSTSIILNRTWLDFGYSAFGETEIGIRFRGVLVPPGSTIINAWIEFEAFADDNIDDCNLIIHGELSSNAAIFTTKADFVGRPRTNKFVEWPEIAHWTSGVTYNTPDITPIIQEIIDQAGWASNRNIAIFLRDYGSSFNALRRAFAWDGEGDLPTLYIIYATTWDVGLTARCAGDNVVLNKQNYAGINTIFNYDASGPTYSANLANTSPHNLLPAPPADGDIVYFASDTSYDDSGPFDNLVFDISSTVHAIYGGVAEITWEYWDGAAWSTLYVRDNSNDGRGPFSETGVRSVHWVPPSDWATTAVNGVTGWWVRARAIITTPPADSITPIQQVNQPIFTSTWPHVEADDTEMGGDIESLLHIQATNSSGALPEANTQSGELWSDRIIVATRSVGRGEDFTPFLNYSDAQQPLGIGVVFNTGGIAYSSFVEAPTGRAVVRTTIGGSVWTTCMAHSIYNPEISKQYYGRYHAFVRAHQQSGSSGNVRIRLQVRNGYGLQATTRHAIFPSTNDWTPLDLGEIQIPATNLIRNDEQALGLELQVQMWSDTAAIDVTLYDLVLVPVDEFVGDFINPRPVEDTHLLMSYYPADENQRSLHIDSIEYHKFSLRALQREYADPEEVRMVWQNIGNQPAVLKSSGTQRLYFFAQRYDTDDEEWYSEPHIAHSIQAWRVWRYIMMRGAS